MTLKKMSGLCNKTRTQQGGGKTDAVTEETISDIHEAFFLQLFSQNLSADMGIHRRRDLCRDPR